jgi:uncharacterized protein (TIGR02996 family)
MGFFDSVKGMLGIAPPKSEEELALLRAIGERPRDDAARLAYASYLEARNDPMGRYIRCAVEAQSLPDVDPRKAQLSEEADELVSTHGKKWVRPLKELELEPILMGLYLPSLWFNGGLIEEITVDKRGVVPGKLERLLELAPALRKIAFARCSPDWNAIAGAPLMRRITALELADVKPSLADVKVLAASPNLAGLEELDLSDKQHGVALAKAVAQAPQWKRLKVLNLYGCELGVEGAQALAASAQLAGLTHLDLGSNQLGDEGAAALAASPHLRNLQSLVLRSNGITAMGTAALASAGWQQLHELDLESNSLDGPAVASLAAAQSCSRLRSLKLGWNRCGDSGAIAWANSPALASVQVLQLSGNELSDTAIAALANSPHAANLVELDLSGNPFTNVDALCKSPHLKKLKKLTLYSVELDDADKSKLSGAFGEEAIEA